VRLEKFSGVDRVIFKARERGGFPGGKGHRPSAVVPDFFLSSMSAGSATGGCAGTATAASAGYGACLSALAFAYGGKEGKSTAGVHPLALSTSYGIIGLAHRAQDVELCLAIVTAIFVDRHSYHLVQLFFSYILPLFVHLVKVEGHGKPRIRNPRLKLRSAPSTLRRGSGQATLRAGLRH